MLDGVPASFGRLADRHARYHKDFVGSSGAAILRQNRFSKAATFGIVVRSALLIEKPGL
jgi:hypothetical protein